MVSTTAATCVLFMCGLLITVTECEVIKHSTNLGEIIGVEDIFENEPVYVFKKIPFAKPPIGELRFMKPQPTDLWNGTLDASTYGPSCWQSMSAPNEIMLPNTNISEDCLYLNIFIPRNMSQSRAVMVWIHGGSFVNGQGMAFDGKQLALHGDVIVVTINYRLNVFGFFSTGDDVAPGNFGIWDQRQAIIWVNKHIAEFGGYPKRITVFGESAGGVSVSLQISILQNIGLFQRAIQESGSFLGPRDFATESVKNSLEISKILSCKSAGTETSIDLVKCVRNATATDLFDAFSKINSKHDTFSLRIPLGPISDGDLIPFNIRSLMADPNSGPSRMFNSIDYIGGNTDGEAGLFLYGLYAFQRKFDFNVKLGIPSRVLCNNVIPTITEELFGNCSDISEAICHIYSPKEQNSSLQIQTDMAANMYGDFVKVSPIVKLLDYHTKFSTRNTYQYMFTHKPDKGVMVPRPLWLKGANHADELPFVFGFKSWYHNNNSFNPDELVLSSRVMTYWSNFAKNGNPNGNGTSIWPKYETESKEYMNLSIKDSVGNHLWGDRMTFWTTSLPKKIKHCSEISAGVTCSPQVFSMLVIVPMLIISIFD